MTLMGRSTREDQKIGKAQEIDRLVISCLLFWRVVEDDGKVTDHNGIMNHDYDKVKA